MALQHHITSMIYPVKRNHVSCMQLIEALSETTMTIDLQQAAMSIPGRGSPKTPMPTHYGSSPEMDRFFADVRPQSRQQVSRWKDDWEELEMLVSVFVVTTIGCLLTTTLVGERGVWFRGEGSTED